MRRGLWSRRLSAVTAVVAGAALSVGLSGLVPAVSAQAAAGASPRSVGELDCNGLSPIQRPVKDVTHSFELTIAPWFSITVCDPHSAPLTPCKPQSDANAPSGRSPGAGAAFVELQFYPSGSRPLPTASAATTRTGAPR
jgi:hypothetical protein